MTYKLFIGYRMRAAVGLKKIVPAITPPSNYKDKDKIAAFVAEAKAAFEAEAKNMPYTGTFDEVFLVDPAHEQALQWVYSDDPSKPSIAVRVSNYLLKTFPKAWEGDIGEHETPQVIFIGFDPKRFLKVLGLECSLPRVGKALPPRVWYGSNNYRDILEAVQPDAYCKRLDIKDIAAERRPTEEAAGKAWDALLAGWDGPHQNPKTDVSLTVELATQLRLIGG